MDWIFSILTKEHDVQVKTLLLKSFFETFKLEAENPKLKEFSTVSNLLNYVLIEYKIPINFSYIEYFFRN